MKISIFARFQIIIASATLIIWYMTLMAENAAVATTTVEHQQQLRATFETGPREYSNKKQILRQIQSTDELEQQYHLLTIAIDRRYSCPDLCTFVHPLLPSWVRYRQLDFNDEKDLAAILQDNTGHVIVVARTNIINIANWAVSRREQNANASTGLFHNADERFHKGEIWQVYDKFDYVLRQYYRRDEDGKFHGYSLNALGNYTCGKKQQSLPNNGAEPGPTWGVHWVPLNAHNFDISLLHHVTANFPTSLRPNNCSFIGRADVKRSKGERQAMKTSLETEGPELNCTVEFTGSFSSGHSKFEYYNYDISLSKIGLSPRGSAIETHRLAELLQMGAVPAVLSEDYLYATFRSVPAIIGKDWPTVVQLMKQYILEERDALAGNRLSKLEVLSREGTKYYRDLEICMMADMDFILKGAFGLSKN